MITRVLTCLTLVTLKENTTGVTYNVSPQVNTLTFWRNIYSDIVSTDLQFPCLSGPNGRIIMC